VFLRKLAPGGVSRSYGIAVARLAGLPGPVVERAREILARLEKGGRSGPPRREDEQAPQLGLFAGGEHPALARLRELDPLRLTPLEALAALDELKRALD
jgi:DNA mismatch repair protein MutS